MTNKEVKKRNDRKRLVLQAFNTPHGRRCLKQAIASTISKRKKWGLPYSLETVDPMLGISLGKLFAIVDDPFRCDELQALKGRLEEETRR